jgi:hypothetical protein
MGWVANLYVAAVLSSEKRTSVNSGWEAELEPRDSPDAVRKKNPWLQKESGPPVVQHVASYFVKWADELTI